LASGGGALLASPAALEVLQSPALGSLLANPGVLSLLGNPQVVAALSDPAALGALLADPTLGPILGAVLADPAIAGLLTNPAAIALLTNAGVQALLADPAALTLVLDARTLQVLANPANLPTLTLPVLIHRERKAAGSDGDKLTLNEQVTTTIEGTATEVPGFEKTDANVIVDRVTKAYLAGGDGGRTGQWGMPFDADKDAVYDAYVSVAAKALAASYDGTEDIKGLETFRYVIKQDNVPYAAADPATGLPMVTDVDVVVWIEPNSGVAVHYFDTATASALAPDGTKYVRFTADMSYTDATVPELFAIAEDDKARLTLYGTTLPYSIIIIGLIASAGMLAMDRRKPRRHVITQALNHTTKEGGEIHRPLVISTHPLLLP
jgi:hypothetical protein